jgi:hydroxyacylglutathione hydrolase
MTFNLSDDSPFFIETFPVGPLQCNCSVIADKMSKKAMIVDPGGEPEKILRLIARLDFTVVAIIHTHAHLDHILAAGDIKQATGAPIYLHREDKFLWDILESQCAMIGIPYKPVPDPDYFLKDDQDLACCGGIAIHTPGHSPGSMSFWFERYKTLVAGDTLFQGSIGRTDLWGGSFDTIKTSIIQRLYTLNDEALVVTGHGPNTRIGIEKVNNNFVRI